MTGSLRDAVHSHRARYGPGCEARGHPVASGRASSARWPACQLSPRGTMVSMGGIPAEWAAENRPGWHVSLWVIWLIAAGVLGVAEVLTTTLALGLIAAGALAAGLTGAAGGGPVALRRLRRLPGLRTGAAALVGQTGYVLDDVTPRGGRVRIGGEEWSARPYDDRSVIPAGSEVDVLQIKGATALVHPRE